MGYFVIFLNNVRFWALAASLVFVSGCSVKNLHEREGRVTVPKLNGEATHSLRANASSRTENGAWGEPPFFGMLKNAGDFARGSNLETPRLVSVSERSLDDVDADDSPSANMEVKSNEMPNGSRSPIPSRRVTGSDKVFVSEVVDSEANQVAEGLITVEPAESWHIKGVANAVVTTEKTLFVGGDFTEIYDNEGESLSRRYLAALDRYTGEPTDFAPKIDGKVWALALSPDGRTLYVGGSFLTAEGVARKRLAAYDIETGMLTSFVIPPPNRALRAIAVDKDRVYIGGLFTKVGTEDRQYIAAFDSTTGELVHGFDASPNGRIKAIVVGADRLWIGGDFTRINGVRQEGIGALDLADWSLKKTDGVAYPVIALAASDEQLFVAGGGPGGRAAAFDMTTGTEQWEISSDGNFQAVDVDEGRFVYFGGHYEIVEGDESIDRLTRHDKKTGRTDVSWLPRVNGIRSINAIDVTPNGLYVGGDFTKMDGEPHEGFAIVPGLTN